MASPLSPTRPSYCWFCRWLLHKERGTSMALLRIGVGLTCFATFTSIIVTGQVEAMWLDPQYGGYRELNQPPPYLFEWLGGLTPTTLWGTIAVLMVSALSLAVGLLGRVSALVLLQAHYAVMAINGQTSGCDDQLIHNALWLLILARSTATLSLGCRLRTGRWTSAELVSAWPRYLAICQIIVVYFVTGLSKTHETWEFKNLSALYFILQDPFWHRWDMSWLAWYYPAVQVATALTVIWEMSAPFLIVALLCRRVRNPVPMVRFINMLNFRRWFVFIGLGVHLGIWIFMGLGNFTWISCSFYFCLYAPDEWDRQRPEQQPTRPSSLLNRLTAWAVTLYFILHLAAIGYGSYPHTNEERKEIWPPLRAYYKYCGTRQGWPMFSGSSKYARRLYVDIREGSTWRTVFGQGTWEHTWRSYQLNAEHLRAGVYYSMTQDWRVEALADWFAVRAAADFPDAERMRLRIHYYTILTPEEVCAGHTEPHDVEETIIADVDLRTVRQR